MVSNAAPTNAEIIADGRWLAHRYDEQGDNILFRLVDREHHDRITFLTDRELGEAAEVRMPRSEALGLVRQRQLSPARYIIHSAFCCSTLLSRALDVPGSVTSYKEPQILNDVVGLQLRGGDPRQVAAAMDVALALLDRPLSNGEAVVVKPSNLINPLLPLQMKMRPSGRMLLLHAPLPDYLGSIARKEIEGRAWVRELMWKFINLGMARRFGYSDEDLYRHSDLQVAALGWLAQQALFADLAREHGETVTSLSSEQLTGQTTAAVAALVAHFDLPVSAEQVAASDAFTRHSKSGERFDGDMRRKERDQGHDRHARELAIVQTWAGQVANHAGIQSALPNPLI
nr:hypothetical protein [uncultured Sphingomonas sp.]